MGPLTNGRLKFVLPPSYPVEHKGCVFLKDSYCFIRSF